MLAMDELLGSWTTTCLVGITTVILIYWYSIRNHAYWKKQGVPFVKPFPLFGTQLQLFRKPVQDIDIERYLKFGTVYGEFEGSKAMISIADPALLKDVFVKDFSVFSNRRVFESGNQIFDKMLFSLKGDEEWKRIRTIITPTFTTGKIKRMLSIFTDCSKTLVTNFSTAAMEGKPVDAKKLFGAFTMDVIASSAFSTKIDSHNDPENQFVKYASVIFNQKLNWKILLLMFCPWVFKFFKLAVFPESVEEFFNNATLKIIEERKRTGQVRNDFLQLLMDTAKEVEEGDKSEIPEKGDIASNYGVQEDINPHIFKSVTSKKLSMNELVAQCFIFFVAGYETTASTLAFASYLLALNPDIQERLRAEVDESLKDYEGEVTYEAIKNMKYLDNVISETMRMYPPLCRLERTANADYKFGDTGIAITKDTLVNIPVYALHRNPNIYPDPEKFDPNRFTLEERAKRDQYAYLPFGAGPRNCVAMRFALMEVKVCLALVIANFNIKRCSETKVPLEFGNLQSILQPKGIILEMEIRKDSPLLKQESNE